MQHNGTATPGLRGGGPRPAAVPAAHCWVYLAHRWQLQDWHLSLLGQVERERCRRYRLAADRDRFTLAAVLLRMVAGRAIGVPAAAVSVDRTCRTCGGPHGRPRLPGTGWQVSISHSGDVVAVAMTVAGPVGVDVEQYGVGHADLVSTVCTATEFGHVGSAADFYAYWTRKEAVLKATGEGLRRRMTSIEVTPPSARPALISPNGPGIACRMADLPLAGYAGAVAVLTESDVLFDVLDAGRLLQDRDRPAGYGSVHHLPGERSPRCA